MTNNIFLNLKSALASGSLLSLILAMLLAYVGGVLSSVTPCIYPLIPITVGFIGGRTERSIKEGWVLSSCYVLGMAFIYSILGIIAGLSGKIFGSLTNTTSWYIAVGIIMIASSLWMLDVINFDLNTWIQKISYSIRKTKKHESKHPAHHLHRHDQKQSIFGAFFLGATSGFIAAPCTTPVLTTILSFIATEKSILAGGALMFAFACGLGTILVALGTFAGAIKILPKSGQWLKIIKTLCGLIILGLGEYFIFKAGTLK